MAAIFPLPEPDDNNGLCAPKVRYPVNADSLRTTPKEWDVIILSTESRFDLSNQVRSLKPSDAWYTNSTEKLPEDNPHTLGLHWASNSKGVYIRPSYFVGAVWLDEEETVPLVVKPKIPEIDALAMFTAIADSHTVNLSELFNCDPEGQPIPGEPLPDLTLLQIAAYLAALAEFVQRHLRQGFTRVQENLTGRIKGRVRIPAQLRENLAFGRLDRAACEFTVMSLDTLENRILKAALDACTRYLANLECHLAPQLARWASIARAALAGVPEYRVNPRDWGQTHKTGLMRPYAHPLALARMILQRLRTDSNGITQEEAKTIPFFLDMNQLFEAWVGIWLAKTGIKFEAQTEFRNPIIFRPDFIARAEQIVVDAKYKDIAKDNRTSPSSADVYQALGYARLLAFAENRQESSYKETWLAYPGTPREEPLRDVAACWERRGENEAESLVTWPDGFRFGVLKIDFPTRNEPI